MTDFWQSVAIAMSGAMWLIAFLTMGLALSAIHRLEQRVKHLESTAVRAAVRCRGCGATEEVVIASGDWWAEVDLCSSCADDKASSLEGGRGR